MPTFDTPEPITATDRPRRRRRADHRRRRTDTVVEVRPSDPANDADVQRRRADPRRVRRRAAAGQGAQAALLAVAQHAARST